MSATHTNLVAALMALPSLKDQTYKAVTANILSMDVVETAKLVLLDLTKMVATVLRANMDVAPMGKPKHKERSSWDALIYQKTDKARPIIIAMYIFVELSIDISFYQ